MVPAGSFFFVGSDPKEGQTSSSRVFAVTALHVIDGLKNKGVKEVVLRLNPVKPDSPFISVKIPIDRWFVHPTDKSIDVAIAEQGISGDADHLVFPFALFANEQTFNEHEIGLGD